MTRIRAWFHGMQVATLLVCAPAFAEPLRDLYFGEALFHAYQGDYFGALERLDTELGQHYGLDEPQRDPLHYHVKQAEFSVGDFELNYRMHHRAGRAIKAVLEGDVDPMVRNEAAFRLARIHFQKGQMADALHALDRIEGRMRPEIRDDVQFLRANVFMAVGRSADAIAILQRLQNAPSLTGFAAFNLGVAMLNEGRSSEGLEQLDKAGLVTAAAPITFGIRDKSNLVLGTMLLKAGDFERAKTSLDRVRLNGPLSNQALLGSGWADASAKEFERALVPWGILAERESTDSAVQEAMLALPYAYSQLNVHGRAALLYGRALESFGSELQKLDASIESIRAGRFLEALVREEIHQDKDWVIRLRQLPASPETFYLIELLASHDFHTALQNYLDLDELRKKLTVWLGSFDAFEDMIAVRGQYYEPLLPGVDQQFRELDSRIRVRIEQYELLTKRLQNLLIAPRPEFLATTDERVTSDRLQALDTALGGESGAQADRLRERTARLQGVITFTLRTQYDERLSRFYQHLQELETAKQTLDAQYEAFVRVRQAATHSYVGYDGNIKRLRTRVRAALAKTELLMARQGKMVERVAIRELDARQKRLMAYQDQARYALADSYDRAARAQSIGGQ